MEKKKYRSDVLVIGGGVAGLFAAITACEMGKDVILVDKAYSGKSGASIMASGFLAVFNREWDMDYNDVFDQVVEYGENLNHVAWLDIMIHESWSVYESMRDWGVEFPCPEPQMKDYSRDKIRGNRKAGRWGMVPLKHREITPKLRKYAHTAGVRLIDRVMIAELIRQNSHVIGAVGFEIETGLPAVFEAAAIIMCAGENCFRSPGMNIAELTGDADAMAYRAGADISGKEFPDMHMNIERDPVWKGNGELYPAFWNFVDGEGRFIPMKGFDLAMVSVIHAGKGPVMWNFEHATEEDIVHMENYKKRRGMPMETERVDLGYKRGENANVIGGSAAGGVAEQTAGIWPVDLYCSSTVPGLYAAGDCCCTWAWGAINSYGPPGLMPAGVTGRRAARGAIQYIEEQKSIIQVPEDERVKTMIGDMQNPLERKTGFDPRWVCQLLQNTMMPYYVLHIKDGDRLNAALTMVTFLANHLVPMLHARDPHELRLCHEVKNMVLNAEMILRSSLARQESRGWHYREDFPKQDDKNWLAWIRMRSSNEGMIVKREPMPKEFLGRLSDSLKKGYDKKWLAWEQT